MTTSTKITTILDGLSDDARETLDTMQADFVDWRGADSQHVRDLVASELIEVAEDRDGFWRLTKITDIGKSVHELLRNLQRTFAERFDRDTDHAHGAFHDGWNVGADTASAGRMAHRWEQADHRYGIAASWVASYYDYQAEHLFGVYADDAAKEIAAFLLESYEIGMAAGIEAVRVRDQARADLRGDASDRTRWQSPGHAAKLL